MSSAALYKAFIEVGASEERATTAAEDVVQVSQLSELATKSDMAQLIMTVQASFAKAQSDTDARFAKAQSGMDTRFANIQSEMDARFAKQQEEMRLGFAKQQEEMRLGFAKQREEMQVGFAKMENRMIKWMVYCGFLYTGLLITAHSFLT